MERTQRTLPERLLVLLHRWLGITLAILMTVWAASGIVMTYVAFPELTPQEHLAGLQPLDLGGCCSPEVGDLLAGYETLNIQMLNGRPIARVSGQDGAAEMLSLRDGQWIAEVTADFAAEVAADHLRHRNISGRVAEIDRINSDQWTVNSKYSAHRPLFKVSFDTIERHVLYVSGTSGTVVQDTTARERFWNWLGAVPHWLYFRAFRERQALWYSVVVHASLLGTVLAASGLYLGIARIRSARGRRTPYIGPMRWHHVSGLAFGTLTLSWMFSGLVSMNPWGWLESQPGSKEYTAEIGARLDAATVEKLISRANAKLSDAIVGVEISTGAGEGQVVLTHANGRQHRLAGPSLISAPPTGEEVVERLSNSIPGVRIAAVELLQAEDAYYFGHRTPAKLPVIRVILSDSEQTRYYFDAETGALVRRVDGAARRYRWLHHGLHRLDFAGFMRTRPLREVLLLSTLSGVTLLCGVGCWVGYRRLRYLGKRVGRRRTEQLQSVAERPGYGNS